MIETVRNVYGPYTIECGPFGRFTPFLLWFRPMHVYETPDAVTVYKVLRGDMYILLVIRKPHHHDCQGGFHEPRPGQN